jgi:hypothetical protein
MNPSTPWILAAAVALVPACSDSEPEPEGEIVRLEIAAHREACVLVDNALCMYAREAGETDFQYQYDGIIGFTAEWGHTYEIEVEERPIVGGGDDGSSIERELVKVIKDVPVAPDVGFSWFVPGCSGCTPHLTLTTGTTGELMDGTPFQCSEAVCGQLRDRIGGVADYTIDFEFGGRTPLPLTITAVGDAPASS